MDDPVRLIVYVIMGLVWFFVSAKSRQGGERREGPWEELPPTIPRPRPRREPPQPAPTDAPVPPRKITIGPKKESQLTLADALQQVAVTRAAVPAPALACNLTPALTTPAPDWATNLASSQEIAEGIILSAILGPPKASAYLRRVTRYRGAPS